MKNRGDVERSTRHESPEILRRTDPSLGPSPLDNEGSPSTSPAVLGRGYGPREGVALTRDLSQPPLSGLRLCLAPHW